MSVYDDMIVLKKYVGVNRHIDMIPSSG